MTAPVKRDIFSAVPAAATRHSWAAGAGPWPRGPGPCFRFALLLVLVGGRAAGQPHAGHLGPALGFRAFSCDTRNLTVAGGNVFSAVPAPTTRHNCPAGAGPTADPLGPCFTAPSVAAAALSQLPAGAQALSLESGSGMYYLQDSNASADRWGGMGPNYYMDTLPGPGKVQGPWADAYAAAMPLRMAAWFGELKRVGGAVDLILSDFEMGYHSSSYNWAHQPTADGSDPTSALLADKRWPALRDKLSAAGKPYGVEFGAASMRGMKSWGVADWRMHVWDEVVAEQYVADLLNRSVFQPIAAVFPRARFSNFGKAHHTDPSGILECVPAPPSCLAALRVGALPQPRCCDLTVHTRHFGRAALLG